MMAIPILGQDILLTEVLRGEPLGPLSFGVSAGVAIALSFGCLYATARLFKSERIIFAR